MEMLHGDAAWGCCMGGHRHGALGPPTGVHGGPGAELRAMIGPQSIVVPAEEHDGHHGRGIMGSHHGQDPVEAGRRSLLMMIHLSPNVDDDASHTRLMMMHLTH